MSISLVLLGVLGVALLVPLFGSDDEDDRNEILGSPDPDDDVQGTEGNDLIRTFLGDDRVSGNGGNDEIRSGGDDDEVYGGDGLDFVRAGEGNDEVYGGEDNDRIFGDQGDDLLDGERGADVVRGGRGDDLIFGGVNALLDDGGNPVSNFDVADSLSGEDDDDTIFAWGGGSFLGGGQNDDENPGSNNDTLVMVTGEGEMENRTGNNTNIGLANLQDNQRTEIIVRDFDPTADSLVLTVDYATTGTPVPQGDAEFTVNYSFEEATDDRGAGMEIRVSWDNRDGDVTDTEGARAFLLGFTSANATTFGLDASGGSFDPEDPAAPLEIDVYLTNEASYDDPVSTLLGLGIVTPAMAAQGFTLT